MIRRDIDLGDGVGRWLLVSQVEHARLSGVLADRCLSHFGQASAVDGDAADLEPVRQELLEAIIHHDDGWTAWESQPGLDSQGRPLSFRELPLDESLANWSSSIRSAADLGPLAAWTVAGHFAALLETSEREKNQVEGKTWLTKTGEHRAAWLSEWRALNPALHTNQLAEEALQWVQTFDAMSLWLCSVCPAAGEQVSQWPECYSIGSGSSLEALIGPDPTAEHDRRCQVVVEPWRFDVPELEIEASAQVVPVRRYQSSEELLSAGKQHRLRWLLVKGDR